MILIMPADLFRRAFSVFRRVALNSDVLCNYQPNKEGQIKMTTENLRFNLFEIFDNMMGDKKKLRIQQPRRVHHTHGRHSQSNPRPLGNLQDRRRNA
nr:MAG: hypothetical protein [Bacteriophage sp.]